MSANDLADTAAPPARWRAWCLAIRPRTLPLSVSPVLVGSTLALTTAGSIDWSVPPVAVIAAAAIQAGTNLHNDARDSINGTDGADRLGPQRACENGWLDPEAVLRVTHCAFLVAFLSGLHLVWIGGTAILILGLASIAAGYAYSGGPWPIARTPLGEFFVVAFFGIGAVWGTAWLAAGQSPSASLFLGAAVGMLAAAVLLINNTRDRHGDQRAGRRTLAVLVGRRRAVTIHAALVLAPFALVALVAVHAPGLGGGSLALLSLPTAWRAIHRFRDAHTGAEFNDVLHAAMRLQARFAVLMCIGLIIGWALP